MTYHSKIKLGGITMGYRHHFFEAPKAEVERIKDMSEEQFFHHIKTIPDALEEDGEDVWVNFHIIVKQRKIFELGKLDWDDTAVKIAETGVPLFNDEEMQKYYENYDPYVVGKEGLLKAIEIYKENVVRYYNGLLSEEAADDDDSEFEEPRTRERKWEKHLKDKLRAWQRPSILNLDETKEQITDSWEYEYVIFELIRLLKSINWEENTVLFYGY
jgi:hypothetical protein